MPVIMAHLMMALACLPGVYVYDVSGNRRKCSALSALRKCWCRWTPSGLPTVDEQAKKGSNEVRIRLNTSKRQMGSEYGEKVQRVDRVRGRSREVANGAAGRSFVDIGIQEIPSHFALRTATGWIGAAR